MGWGGEAWRGAPRSPEISREIARDRAARPEARWMGWERGGAKFGDHWTRVQAGPLPLTAMLRGGQRGEGVKCISQSPQTAHPSEQFGFCTTPQRPHGGCLSLSDRLYLCGIYVHDQKMRAKRAKEKKFLPRKGGAVPESEKRRAAWRITEPSHTCLCFLLRAVPSPRLFPTSAGRGLGGRCGVACVCE